MNGFGAGVKLPEHPLRVCVTKEGGFVLSAEEYKENLQRNAGLMFPIIASSSANRIYELLARG